jgi:hypothetical protein
MAFANCNILNPAWNVLDAALFSHAAWKSNAVMHQVMHPSMNSHKMDALKRAAHRNPARLSQVSHTDTCMQIFPLYISNRSSHPDRGPTAAKDKK